MNSTKRTAGESRVTTVDGKLRLVGKDRGFTIIELLVVMAIIGLLAAIAIPVFSKLKANAYDSAIANDIRQIAVQAEAVNTSSGAFPAAGAGSGGVMAAGDAVLANVKLSNGPIATGNEIGYYAINTSGQSFAVALYDARTLTVFCYQSSNGGATTKYPSATSAAAIFSAATTCENGA